MEKINKHRFELTTRDFRSIGSSLEKVLESVLERGFGEYKVDNEDTLLILTLRIVEGMDAWQWKTNKGIELRGSFNVSLRIYDKAEMQRKIDDALDGFHI